MAQSNVVPLMGPTQQAVTPVWPIAGDVPDLQLIVRDQAKTIQDKGLLIDAYRSVLGAAQVQPPPLPAATGTGTATGTSLAVTNQAGGLITLGAFVSGTGVPAGTTITAQQSGTSGGNGTYTTSVATTASAAALTFTPPLPPMNWPSATDAPTLNQIMQDQTAILKTQNSLIQQYQALLNDSNTAAPPSGP